MECPWTKPNLLSTQELSSEETRFLLNSANYLSRALKQGDCPKLLQGKTLAQLFFEDSTRTRNSFDLAVRRLGGSTLNFTGKSSSVSKGETLIDTARTLEAMGPHGIIVRHHSAGGANVLSRFVEVPVVNAGDGFHEHPTQALLDLYTMEKSLGSIHGKHVMIVGDIAHSRVARSNIHLLRTMGAEVSVCGPPTLLPPFPEALGVRYAYRPEELLPEADVVMTLRVQFERQNKMQIPSVAEYTRFWGINTQRAQMLKPTAIIMHPGPLNRGVELSTEVADGANSVILQQVQNGVLIRMSALAILVARDEFLNWLDSQPDLPAGGAA